MRTSYRLVCGLLKRRVRDKEILEILKSGKAGNKKTGEFKTVIKKGRFINLIIKSKDLSLISFPNVEG